MSTNFPGAIDSLTNPQPSDYVAVVDHAAQHTNANDAIEAIEAKVGANGSAVTTSHDYKLSGVTGGDKAVSKTGVETLTNKTLTSPVLNTPSVNVGSDAAGDLYYRSGLAAFTRLPVGADGSVLSVNGGFPAWASAAAFATRSGVQDGSYVYAATSTGNDTYVITLSPAVAAYTNGQKFRFKVDVANTGPATLNVNGLGAISIVRGISTALTTGDIVANQIIEVIYNSTGPVFQMTTVSSIPVVTVNDAPSTSTDNTWFSYTVPYLFYTDGDTGTESPVGWEYAGMDGSIDDASMGGMGDCYMEFTSDGYIINRLPGALSMNYTATDNKAIKIKYRLLGGSVDTNEVFGHGLTSSNGADLYAARTAITAGIRFVNEAGTLYAQNADGVTATSTDISSGLTLTNWNVYEIIFTPGVDAKFYVNGVLKATHTTNLPTAGLEKFGFGMNLDAGSYVGNLSPITVSLQM
jgi:hypothetical protein